MFSKICLLSMAALVSAGTLRPQAGKTQMGRKLMAPFQVTEAQCVYCNKKGGAGFDDGKNYPVSIAGCLTLYCIYTYCV